MNVLFVSIAFPPKQDPECLQTAKYYKYLAQSDLKISIATSSVPTLNMSYDESLKKYDKGYEQKLEYRIQENKYLNFLIRKLYPSSILVPDSKIKFVKNWKKITRDLKNKPDVIYSRSFPLSSAVTALKLKEFYKVPWIMHLSDPWADTPSSSTKFSVYKKNKALEKKCFDAADKISFTTEKTLDFYKQLYPEHLHKFEIFPNVYDSEDLNHNQQPVAADVLRIVYTGGMAANRGPLPIIKIIEHLRTKGFDVDRKIELVLAGDIDRKNKAILSENNHPYINFMGRTSYEEARRLQRSAHLLLIIEEAFDDASKAMFFPSKILDYLLARRKMFAITTTNSQVDLTFKKLSWPSFSHNQLDEAANFILESFNNLSNPQLFFQNELPEHFDAKYNANRLIDLMKQI